MLFKIQRWVDRTTTVIACLICAVFMLIVIYNVAARYFFDGGIQWYMEGAQYLNVWAMFIAGIGLCASNEHLRVSMIDEFLGGRIKTLDRVIVSVLTFAFYLIVAYSAYLLASRSRQTISTMEPLKMSYVYWMLPVTAGLSALAVLLEIVCFLKGKPVDEKGDKGDHVYID